jgi:hypothetical protein
LGVLIVADVDDLENEELSLDLSDVMKREDIDCFPGEFKRN